MRIVFQTKRQNDVNESPSKLRTVFPSCYVFEKRLKKLALAFALKGCKGLKELGSLE